MPSARMGCAKNLDGLSPLGAFGLFKAVSDQPESLQSPNE